MSPIRYERGIQELVISESTDIVCKMIVEKVIKLVLGGNDQSVVFLSAKFGVANLRAFPPETLLLQDSREVLILHHHPRQHHQQRSPPPSNDQ